MYRKTETVIEKKNRDGRTKIKKVSKGSKQVEFPNSIGTCRYLQILTCPKNTCMHSTRDLRETPSKKRPQSPNKDIEKTNAWSLQIVSRFHV